MDDERDTRDDGKESLRQAAKALRNLLGLSQDEVERRLGLRCGRLSEIETSGAATPEMLRELAESLGYRAVHLERSIDLFDLLAEDRRRPFDPIGPTPEQEVSLYRTSKALGDRLGAIYRDHIRRENLARALQTAAADWNRLNQVPAPRRRAELRRNPEFHTWRLCLFLCAATVRLVNDRPKAALHVGRLAVVVARCCTEPWTERLVAYALAHLANAYRVRGDFREADLLFGKANRLWSSPGAAAADPGVLDPGRILELEASLRKDQRRLPEAMALLDRALPISRAPGRILVKRANVLSLRGSYEKAIETLRGAAELLVHGTPRDKALVDYNMGVNCCHLGRISEAAEFSSSASEILKASKNRIDILRSRWLRARVLDGQGERSTAVDIYRELIEEFKQHNMKYDVALVALELAAVLLALGQTRECRSLTVDLPAYFEAKKIYPEALAAFKVFYDSVRLETATEALARQVAAFLYLAQGTPGLRFRPEL